MGLSQKSVTYCTEVDSLLSLVVTAIVDVKAGKSAGQVLQDLEPKLVTSLTALGDLKAELSNRKDLETTIALKTSELADAVIG